MQTGVTFFPGTLAEYEHAPSTPQIITVHAHGLGTVLRKRSIMKSYIIRALLRPSHHTEGQTFSRSHSRPTKKAGTAVRQKQRQGGETQRSFSQEALRTELLFRPPSSRAPVQPQVMNLHVTNHIHEILELLLLPRAVGTRGHSVSTPQFTGEAKALSTRVSTYL